MLGESECVRQGIECPSGDWHDEATLRANATGFLGAIWYAKAGATDLRIQVAAHDEKSRNTTYDALADYLS